MRTALACTAIGIWGMSCGLAMAQADHSDIDGLYWIDEQPSSFDHALEKIPLVGLIVRQIRPDAQFVLVRMIDGRLAVQLPEKDLAFTNVRRDGSRLTATMPNPDNRQEMLRLRLDIRGPAIAGELDYGTTTVTWQGRLIREHERDRRRAAELAAAARQASGLQAERAEAAGEIDRLRARVAELEEERDRAESEARTLRSQRQRAAEPPATKPAPTAVAKAPPAAVPGRFVQLRVPPSEETPRGPAIVVAAPGFTSIAGEVKGLPLPLRSLSLNGQALPLGANNRFETTVNIEGQEQRLSFAAVDALGDTHPLTFGVVIRASQ